MRSTGDRAIDVGLALCFVCSSALITVALGHGGFVVGQLLVFPPVAAVAFVLTCALVAVAWFTGRRVLAMSASALAIPALAFVIMTWVAEGVFWLSVLSVALFAAFWTIIVVRAIARRDESASRSLRPRGGREP